MKAIKICCGALMVFLLVLLRVDVQAQKKMSSLERDGMKRMLSVVKDDIEDNYYDPDFHGINIEQRFDAANEKLKDTNTVSQALSVIAQVLLDFNDSHLYFMPPATNLEVEYGYRTRMVGDRCIVTTVKPKSDAEKKGLKQGDQILAVEGFRPTRNDMWKINYFFDTLSKRGQLKLGVLKPAAKEPKLIVVKAKVKKKAKVITRANFFQLFDSDTDTPFDLNLFARFGNTAYWKMPSFSMSPNNVNTMIKNVKGADSLIMDLRGNGGGAVVTLERLASFIFDKDFVIATPKGRKDFDPIESKSKGGDVFNGRLIVLIDSASASASEIFARSVQLEERGVVLGDVSAGAVMMSKQFVNSMRGDSILYGASITIADVIMSDGKSIENTGVTPNKFVVPDPTDIAANRDPVLAEALDMLGVSLSPAEVGAKFKYEWQDNGSVVLKPAKQ